MAALVLKGKIILGKTDTGMRYPLLLLPDNEQVDLEQYFWEFEDREVVVVIADA